MKRKRLLLAVALVTGMLGWNSAQAQTDVTDTYLTNAGFDDGTKGWTYGGSGTNYGGVAAYGSTTAYNSVTNVSVDKFGKSEGNAVHTSAGWGSPSIYTQEVTLPAGTYKLTFDVINRNSSATKITNRFGWVPNSGDAIYNSSTDIIYNAWQTLSVSFTLTEETTGKISIGMVSTSGSGSGAVAKLFTDNVKIFKMDDTEGKPTIANPIDYSDLINQSTWSYAEDDGSGSASALTNNVNKGDWPYRCAERYRGNGGHYGKKLYQTVSVPAGVYQVQAACMSAAANGVEGSNALADGTLDNAYFYANDEETTYALANATSSFQKQIVTLTEDGTIEFGVKTVAVGANWNAIGCATIVKVANNEEEYYKDLFSTYISQLEALQTTATQLLANSDYDNVTGSERTTLVAKSTATVSEQSLEAYESLLDEVQAAIDAFTAAKTNYDALIAEIAKATALGADASAAAAQAVADDPATTAASALAATQDLKVAEYNYVTGTYQYAVELGTWKTTGPTGSLSAQHWSGEARSYLEQSSAAWGQNSWTIKYEQDLALPAGNYVFKVAGRQADSDGVTLSLNVSNGGTVLGTVSDFPKGDTGRGIDTSGATNFSEGTYANNNAGRGWEWRYVKFTLDEDATVKVAVDAVATITHMWVSFCDATVQTDNEANISLIAYNIALNDAKTAFNNETDYPAIAQYPNASENIALQEAIAADETLDKTNKEAIDAATETLKNATAAFIDANTNYQDALNALNEALAINPEDYPYADPNKTPTGNLAAPTTAEEATQYAIDMRANYRKFVESHALAEGVEGAENKTDLIINPNYTDNTDAWGWTITQTGGNSNKSKEGESFTDGDGKNDYHYYDYYNGANANQNVYQTVENVPAGRYLVTATMRGAVGLTYALNVTVDGTTYSTPVNTIGANGGIFGAGWNDYSAEFEVLKAGDVELRAKAGPGNGAGWTGVTRWRLVKIADIEYVDVEVTAGGELNDKFYATFSSDKNLDFSAVEGLTAYYVTSASKKELSITPAETVPAGTAILLEGAEAKTYQVPVCSSAAEATNNQLQVSDGTVKGNGTSIFVLGAGKNGVGFYLKKKDSAIAAGKAYLEIEDDGTGETKSFISLSGDDATAISNVEAAQGTGIIYNLNGQRVAAPVKGGLYIMNGKKVLVK